MDGNQAGGVDNDENKDAGNPHEAFFGSSRGLVVGIPPHTREHPVRDRLQSTREKIRAPACQSTTKGEAQGEERV